MINTCPLCLSSKSTPFKNSGRHFYYCNTCKGFYLEKTHLLKQEEEIERYKLHQNHLNDQGYLKFVKPITSSVKRYFNSTHLGLDFGSGNVPVISEKLKEENYEIDIFDPLFENNKEIFKKKYDFITCCEVIEHFYNPKKEFEILYNLLKPNGKLFCMTLIFQEDLNFDDWFYKNDPTHVFIYQKETIQWIAKKFKFKSVKIEDRLITFSK